MASLAQAAVLLQKTDHYKAGVFAAGLQRHGFEVQEKWKREPRPGDAILIWNRCRSNEPIADLYEKAGAHVIVAENGYTSRPEGGKFYALALDHHNGAGRWFVGDSPRHLIPEQRWRQSGGHVLVLPQRGIGARGVAMPSTWGKGILERLARITDRRIVFRPHPGHSKRGKPDTLPHDLAGAHCAVVWASGAGIKSIQLGVPVFHEFARWIGAPGARLLDGDLEDCHTPDRRIVWTRVSWAQWTLEEIASGEAFDGLLNASRGDLFCSGQQPLGDSGPRDGRGRETIWRPSPAALVA